MNDGTQKPIFPWLISDEVDETTDTASTSSETNPNEDEPAVKQIQEDPKTLSPLMKPPNPSTS